MDAVRRLIDDLLPVFELRFVGGELHAQAVAALLVSESPDVSFVDRVSFAVMRRCRDRRSLRVRSPFRARGLRAHLSYSRTSATIAPNSSAR